MDRSLTSMRDAGTMPKTERIYVAETGSALGRGVFTARDFSAGERVEICPVVLLDLKAQPFPGQIRRLLYCWSKTHVALALGYGSFYNHSDHPNLTFQLDPEKLTITFRALRDITAGEQLTISYDYIGEGQNPRKRSWFEIHSVEKIELKP